MHYSGRNVPPLATLLTLRITGICGVLGAIGWTIGDALIIGAKASVSEYPMLLQDYANRISFHALPMMLPSSEPRLAAGALIANCAIPLYLAGSWHLYLGVRAAGRCWGLVILALLVAGNAWSPLGHAAFYFAAMAYKTILLVPSEAHGALLDLGEHFTRVLVIAWLLPVVTLAVVLLFMSLLIALGRTSWPRWMAVVINPVSLVLIGMTANLLPSPLNTWLDGAAFNIGWFVVYLLSTYLLWNGTAAVDQD